MPPQTSEDYRTTSVEVVLPKKVVESCFNMKAGSKATFLANNNSAGTSSIIRLSKYTDESVKIAVSVKQIKTDDSALSPKPAESSKTKTSQGTPKPSEGSNLVGEEAETPLKTKVPAPSDDGTSQSKKLTSKPLLRKGTSGKITPANTETGKTKSKETKDQTKEGDMSDDCSEPGFVDDTKDSDYEPPTPKKTWTSPRNIIRKPTPGAKKSRPKAAVNKTIESPAKKRKLNDKIDQNSSKKSVDENEKAEESKAEEKNDTDNEKEDAKVSQDSNEDEASKENETEKIKKNSVPVKPIRRVRQVRLAKPRPPPMKRPNYKRESNIECKFCHKKLKDYESLNSHLKIKHLAHPDVKGYLDEIKDNRKAHCVICKKDYSSKHQLQIHMKEIHVDESDPDYKKPACPYCSNVYKNKNSLKQHMERVHKSHPRHLCHLCPATFKQKVYLREHIKDIHEGKSEYGLCKYCGKSLPLKSLRRHVQIHGAKRYLCIHCGRGFHEKRNMEVHVKRVHETPGAKPYACMHCDKLFACKQNVDQHIKYVHLKQFEYKCNICNAGFTRKHLLDGHVRTVHMQPSTPAKSVPLEQMYRKHIFTPDGGQTFVEVLICGPDAQGATQIIIPKSDGAESDKGTTQIIIPQNEDTETENATTQIILPQSIELGDGQHATQIIIPQDFANDEDAQAVAQVLEQGHLIVKNEAGQDVLISGGGNAEDGDTSVRHIIVPQPGETTEMETVTEETIVTDGQS